VIFSKDPENPNKMIFEDAEKIFESGYKPFDPIKKTMNTVGFIVIPVKGELNRGLSWNNAVKLAEEAGCRLPTSKEMDSAGITTGNFDQWCPVGDLHSDFWVQTGDDGRLYSTEVPSEAWGLPPDQGWGNNTEAYKWRPTTEGST